VPNAWHNRLIFDERKPRLFSLGPWKTGFMALWMVRSGKYGEREQFNSDNAIVSIGWSEIPDLRDITDRAQLVALMAERHPDKKPSANANWVGQVWTFAKVMQVGDLVAMPLKSAPSIMFGTIKGDYEFVSDPPPGAEHRRKVEWIKTVPRTSIDADLLYSFGAIMTVCNIGRNDAENRIRALLAHETPTKALQSTSSELSTVGPAATPADEIDLDEVLRDAIRTHITRSFDGHAMAELVAAVLRAQGYKTFVSPPGADDGVDVLAGLGPHGFDGPKLAVQVKSGSIIVGTDTFRLFQTAMNEHEADYGLFVSWGGFANPVLKKTPKQFFKIRMWSDDDLIDAILENYDGLPASIQARLPLKRTWMLVARNDDD